MGYDLYMVRKPEGEDERYAAAWAAWHKSLEIRDAFSEEEQGCWTKEDLAAASYRGWDQAPPNASKTYKDAFEASGRAYKLMQAARRSYFRLNIFGMGAICGLMEQAGMLYHDYSKDGWPEFPDDIPEEYWDWSEDDATVDDSDTRDRYKRIEAQVEAWLSWSPEGRLGIPGHKFGSNDGWHVLPEECFYAAATGKAMSDEDTLALLASVGEDWAAPEGVNLWSRWLDFLDLASRHGGFRVH